MVPPYLRKGERVMDYKILTVLGLLCFSHVSSAVEPISTVINYSRIVYQYYRAYENGVAYQSQEEIERQAYLKKLTQMDALESTVDGRIKMKIRLDRIKMCHEENDLKLPSIFNDEVGRPKAFSSTKCRQLEDNLYEPVLIKAEE